MLRDPSVDALRELSTSELLHLTADRFTMMSYALFAGAVVIAAMVVVAAWLDRDRVEA